MDVVLEAEGLTKKYANGRGVTDIHLQVRRGDIYGFFGPNGAGKTTVMKMMVNLCRSDRGTVRMFGLDTASHYVQAMKRVGVLIERPEAYDYFSGFANLRMSLRYYPDLKASRIDEVLELVGLAPYKNEKVGGYSLGMKQRLGIASAILSKPELLILDEPTNGLDIEGMVDIRELMVKLAKEENITLFVSSHLIHEMELMCNRVGILYDGKLIREGYMEDLLAGPHRTLEDYFVAQVREERGAALHE
ncbi:ABC transporter ATP-binding protein [Paenibacillus sp. H1-7]|uniref:ABC transporter ATP-binding protein n=1 Tax=Paenibacillus sp. H1-7 TaxID=2282849 RepID=UPI001EF92AB5|nr:ABC transporter ATP-binding protein [Paenibacillus sp. H1-7]ULL18608.1 ABC transporter ATP-binding protein [Paenibacillus sp. H1-7]